MVCYGPKPVHFSMGNWGIIPSNTVESSITYFSHDPAKRIVLSRTSESFENGHRRIFIQCAQLVRKILGQQSLMGITLLNFVKGFGICVDSL